jgi:hypothetical protein
MIKIDSITFYTTLANNFDLARAEIKFKTDEEVSIYIHSFAFEIKPSIIISNNRVGSKRIEVDGFALGDVVDEFIRRARFANSQANLLLGPPTIDEKEGGRR